MKPLFSLSKVAVLLSAPARGNAVAEGWGCLGILLRGPWRSPTPTGAPPVTKILHLHLSRVAAGADLLEEHLGEIRNLRQRLEESICINDRLREQLEHRLSCAARGNGRRHPSCSSVVTTGGASAERALGLSLTLSLCWASLHFLFPDRPASWGWGGGGGGGTGNRYYYADRH